MMTYRIRTAHERHGQLTDFLVVGESRLYHNVVTRRFCQLDGRAECRAKIIHVVTLILTKLIVAKELHKLELDFFSIKRYVFAQEIDNHAHLLGVVFIGTRNRTMCIIVFLRGTLSAANFSTFSDHGVRRLFRAFVR
jgi:hypothetical protein